MIEKNRKLAQATSKLRLKGNNELKNDARLQQILRNMKLRSKENE